MKSKAILTSAASAALALLIGAILSLPASAELQRAAREPVRIAVIDSGISVKHLDSSRVLAGENFVFPDKDTYDRVGHGTAVASLIIGSLDSRIPSASLDAVLVPLVCVDTYPSGTVKKADSETVAEAIVAAVDRYGCSVINLSMGFVSESDALEDAIDYAYKNGAAIVAACGNDYLTDPKRAYYPAAYDNVIGIGAANADGSIADFSGRAGVDLLAPGVQIQTSSNKNSSAAVTVSGTSYACAYVSAALADLSTKYDSADELYNALLESAETVGLYLTIGLKPRAVMPEALKKALEKIDLCS